MAGMHWPLLGLLGGSKLEDRSWSVREVRSELEVRSSAPDLPLPNPIPGGSAWPSVCRSTAPPPHRPTDSPAPTGPSVHRSRRSHRLTALSTHRPTDPRSVGPSVRRSCRSHSLTALLIHRLTDLPPHRLTAPPPHRPTDSPAHRPNPIPHSIIGDLQILLTHSQAQVMAAPIGPFQIVVRGSRVELDIGCRMPKTGQGPTRMRP